MTIDYCNTGHFDIWTLVIYPSPLPLGVLLFEKSPFSEKSCNGALFKVFFVHQAYDFWKVTLYIKRKNELDL